MRSLFAALVLFAACGSVSSEGGAGGAGGSAGAAGGSTSASGGRASAAGSGGEAAAGASGGTSATGGRVETGGAGGRGETGGAGGAGGNSTGPGVLNAPACKGNFIGSTQPQCNRIADPNQPSNPNAGWQCEVGCSDVPAENATGCVYSGVSYCVPTCSWCHI